MISIVVICVKIFKTVKTMEIQLVRLNEVPCGKVLRIDNRRLSVFHVIWLSSPLHINMLFFSI